jgi:hypothetical protein
MTSTLIFLSLFFVASTSYANEPLAIQVPAKLMQTLKSFEPSAIQFLSSTGNYLVAIDDTTEEDAPLLFLMDTNGNVDKTPVVIEGLSKMTDMESLSQENGYVYVMSSQSRNKKGKILKERNLFVRGKLTGHILGETTVIELRAELIKALSAVSDPRISSMQATFDKLIEIESHYIKNGVVYVGLKDSQSRPGVGLVLEIGKADAIFTQGKLDPAQIRFSTELDFAKSGGTEEKISDISLQKDGSLLVTATLENGGGSVWNYDGQNLRLIMSYESEKPEGITFSDDGKVVVVFDQGNAAPLYTILKD